MKVAVMRNENAPAGSSATPRHEGPGAGLGAFSGALPGAANHIAPGSAEPPGPAGDGALASPLAKPQRSAHPADTGDGAARGNGATRHGDLRDTLASDFPIGHPDSSEADEPGQSDAGGPIVVDQNSSGQAASRISQLSVLVVDDDASIREYLADFLQSDGFQVDAVANASDAIDRVRDGHYHICVLDLMMPDVAGIDLLTQIRRLDGDIAVIILTGYPSLETATAAIRKDVAAYVEKPFSTDEFRAIIADIASKKGLVLRREDDLHQTIGRTIREYRKVRGLTLKQLSRRTGLSVSLLSQIERAESSASVSSLFKVATALDLRMTELFGGY